MKWLRDRRLPFEERPIREAPPSLLELQTMLASYEGNLKRIFNTAGRDYRELNLGEKLATMSVSDALALLGSNGNLVKRPFLVGPGVALAGFDEASWTVALAK